MFPNRRLCCWWGGATRGSTWISSGHLRNRLPPWIVGYSRARFHSSRKGCTLYHGKLRSQRSSYHGGRCRRGDRRLCHSKQGRRLRSSEPRPCRRCCCCCRWLRRSRDPGCKRRRRQPVPRERQVQAEEVASVSLKCQGRQQSVDGFVLTALPLASPPIAEQVPGR